MVFVCLVVVTILKILWAATSAGSVDAVLFYNFARGIEKFGLLGLYPMDAKYNHTPLTGSCIQLLYRFAGGDFSLFAFYLRLAATVADVAVVVGLVRFRDRFGGLPPWWALTVFAASPVSLMVSGFHGNIDPIMTAVLFFALVAVVIDQPVLCGLLFGLACNVKIVPIALGPVFFFFWLARGHTWRFALPAGAILLAGSILPLMVCPRDYLGNVFGYGSTWGVWGVPCLIRLTGWSEAQLIDFHGLSTAQQYIATTLKAAAVSSILVIAWRRRRVAPIGVAGTLGLAWIVFFLCAPGIGVQYMVWFAPFLLLLDARSYTVVTATATVFLAVFYQSCSSQGRFPWFLCVPLGPEVPYWSAVALLVWLAFGYALYRLRGELRGPATDATGEVPATSQG